MKHKLTIGILGILAMLLCACDSSPKIDRDKYDPLVYHKQACQELLKIDECLDIFNHEQYGEDTCFIEYVQKEYSKSKADNLVALYEQLSKSGYWLDEALYSDDEFLRKAHKVLAENYVYHTDEMLLAIHHYFRWYVNNLARLEHELYANSKSKNLFPGKNNYKKDKSYIDTDIKNRKDWERLFSRRMDMIFNKVKLPVLAATSGGGGEGNIEHWAIGTKDQVDFGIDDWWWDGIEVHYSKDNTKIKQLKLYRFDWGWKDMKREVTWEIL